MLLEVLGVLVQREFFWSGVRHVADAGVDAKNEYEERKDQKFLALQNELDGMTRVPDMALTHELVHRIEQKSRCVIDWKEAVEGLSSTAIFTDENGVVDPKARKSSSGLGWINGEYFDDKNALLIESFVRGNIAYLVLGVKAQYEIWYVSRAELIRSPKGDEYPCELLYVSEGWRPLNPSWGGVFLSPGDDKIKEVTQIAFNEALSVFSNVFESINSIDSDVAQDLQNLIKMKTDGMISEQEFVAAKAKLLGTSPT
jgi:hypothetical protein